jgi:hypothetical protein
MKYKEVSFEVALGNGNGNGYYDYTENNLVTKLRYINYGKYLENKDRYIFYIEEKLTLKEQVQEIIKTGYFINNDGGKRTYCGSTRDYIYCINNHAEDMEYFFKDLIENYKSITFEQFIDLDYPKDKDSD